MYILYKTALYIIDMDYYIRHEKLYKKRKKNFVIKIYSENREYLFVLFLYLNRLSIYKDSKTVEKL